MSKEPTTDPSAIFRDWVTQWERSFDSFANQVMGTEGFSQTMNEFQKAQLGAQRLMVESMGQLLSNMNMPTREDVLRLAEAVQALDRRMERLEERLTGEAGSRPSTAKRPPRTKRPPSDDTKDEGA